MGPIIPHREPSRKTKENFAWGPKGIPTRQGSNAEVVAMARRDLPPGRFRGEPITVELLLSRKFGNGSLVDGGKAMLVHPEYEQPPPRSKQTRPSTAVRTAVPVFSSPTTDMSSPQSDTRSSGSTLSTGSTLSAGSTGDEDVGAVADPPVQAAVPEPRRLSFELRSLKQMMNGVSRTARKMRNEQRTEFQSIRKLGQATHEEAAGAKEAALGAKDAADGAKDAADGAKDAVKALDRATAERMRLQTKFLADTARNREERQRKEAEEREERQRKEAGEREERQREEAKSMAEFASALGCELGARVDAASARIETRLSTLQDKLVDEKVDPVADAPKAPSGETSPAAPGRSAGRSPGLAVRQAFSEAADVVMGRVPPRKSFDFVVPPTWGEDMEEADKLKRGSWLVTVPGGEERAQQVAAFNKTAANFQVVTVQRVQNANLYGSYRARLNDFGNEMQGLYHAAPLKDLRSIASTGFNRNYAMKGNNGNGSLCGQGCYFARDALYSTDAKYAVYDSRTRLQYMLVCRVALGKCIRGSRTMTKEVLDDQDVQSTRDSNCSVFVTYTDAQAYPAYLLGFKAA